MSTIFNIFSYWDSQTNPGYYKKMLWTGRKYSCIKMVTVAIAVGKDSIRSLILSLFAK